MRILVLQGSSNIGKTKTINLVWDMLTQANKVGTSTNRQDIGNPAQNDFSDIVMVGNRRIAFYSMGDYSNCLSKAVYDYLFQGCDMLICALSTNTEKINANNTLDRYGAIRINKTVDSNPNTQCATNTTDAQIIFNMISRCS